MRRRIRYRLNPFRGIRLLLLLTCCLFIFVYYILIKLFNWETKPSPLLTRLYPDMPMTIDLRSYSVCHPNKFYLDNITSYYHQYSKQQTCFLIEHLDGGPWWSYVTHEFAEILTNLKGIGIQSNINYRSFPQHIKLNYKTNLTKYFLNACNFNENLYMKNKIPIIILLWDINQLLWNKIHDQWIYLLEKLHIRILVFIDDLHFTTKESFLSRQYLFQYITSEIFSTYSYIFHNYYFNISSSKITWLPHAASSLSYHSINQTAENLLFISGAHIYEWYPCRSRAFLLCQSRKDLVGCLKHPGYGETMKNDSTFFYGGKRYFSYMKKYIFGLGTCQSVHYAIAKLFELPANGLVLVTTNDLIPILERLNLYHNEHFLTIQCSSINRLIQEIKHLQTLPKDKINNIRIKSQEIIYERHMIQHRAQLLHVRLVAQALIAMSSSDKERIQWEQWGRNCDRY
ncbi:unnamed protein product [Rotaria sp. Silwood1]|nr:unnamed protein product [Rotaria sp. Silwood1]CAF1381390.1 unnamed protein product [Rotaria sp. Silwood1]CAF3568785.1 unnamed protein product [Rotaria sp. Silwood1]CAF3611970.1 unnamed protein product [Rotaria sp. Silwood1]CAF4650095.1 unnamed protein product [Rotaria sp. Silwood1]